MEYDATSAASSDAVGFVTLTTDKDAVLEAPRGLVEADEDDRRLRRIGRKINVDIFYRTEKGDNVFTAALIEKIRLVENQIMAIGAYPTFCNQPTDQEIEEASNSSPAATCQRSSPNQQHPAKRVQNPYCFALACGKVALRLEHSGGISVARSVHLGQRYCSYF